MFGSFHVKKYQPKIKGQKLKRKGNKRTRTHNTSMYLSDRNRYLELTPNYHNQFTWKGIAATWEN